MGSLQVEETSAYCTVNQQASASIYQLSNMKHPAQNLNQRPQRLEARTLTATPPSPLQAWKSVHRWFENKQRSTKHNILDKGNEGRKT